MQRKRLTSGQRSPEPGCGQLGWVTRTRKTTDRFWYNEGPAAPLWKMTGPNRVLMPGVESGYWGADGADGADEVRLAGLGVCGNSKCVRECLSE